MLFFLPLPCYSRVFLLLYIPCFQTVVSMNCTSILDSTSFFLFNTLSSSCHHQSSIPSVSPSENSSSNSLRSLNICPYWFHMSSAIQFHNKFATVSSSGTGGPPSFPASGPSSDALISLPSSSPSFGSCSWIKLWMAHKAAGIRA